MNKIIVALCVVLFFPFNVFANCEISLPSLTFVSLSEMNFNYIDGDYIEFYVNKPELLESEFLEIIVDGKNLWDSDLELEKYNLIETSLVSTTEQVLVKYGGQVIDGVCWQSESVSQNEIEDLEEYETYDLPSCFDSTEIGDLHMARKQLIPSNDIDDWELVGLDTPGSKNNFQILEPIAEIEIQSGDLIGYGKVSLNLDGSNSYDLLDLDLNYSWDFGNGIHDDKANPGVVTFSEVGNYVVELKVENSLGASDSEYLFVSVLPEIIQEDLEAGEEEEAEEENKNAQELEEDEKDEGGKEVGAKLELKIIDFMANPEGADSGNEWIDIKNMSEISGYAIGWGLDDSEGQSSVYNMETVYFEGLEIKRIYNSESKVNLNNAGDEVRLIYDGEIVQKILYKKAESGISYLEYDNSGDEISETEDAENKEDEEIVDSEWDGYLDLAINEILPNPEGKDAGMEWVEIYNYGNEKADLGGWKLKLNSKVVSLEGSVGPNDYISIYVSGIANSGANVSLVAFDGTEVDSIEYGKAIEGKSFANLGVEWDWTGDITEAAANPKIEVVEDVVTELDTVSQVISLNELALVYEELDEQVKVGDEVKVKYVGDLLLELEVLSSMDASNAIVGSVMGAGMQNKKLSNKVWLYSSLYLLIAITGFYFRKPLFKFMKTKLEQI